MRASGRIIASARSATCAAAKVGVSALRHDGQIQLSAETDKFSGFGRARRTRDPDWWGHVPASQSGRYGRVSSPERQPFGPSSAANRFARSLIAQPYLRRDALQRFSSADQRSEPARRRLSLSVVPRERSWQRELEIAPPVLLDQPAVQRCDGFDATVPARHDQVEAGDLFGFHVDERIRPDRSDQRAQAQVLLGIHRSTPGRRRCLAGQLGASLRHRRIRCCGRFRIGSPRGGVKCGPKPLRLGRIGAALQNS